MTTIIPAIRTPREPRDWPLWLWLLLIALGWPFLFAGMALFLAGLIVALPAIFIKGVFENPENLP